MNQPDGSSIDVRIVGDENFHYFLTDDGYLLIDDNGCLCYAMADALNRPVSTRIKAANSSQRTAQDCELLENIDTDLLIKNLYESQSAVSAPLRRPGLFVNANFPTLGTQRTIVILVEYQDVKFRLSDPADYFYRLLNEPGFSDYGATGSARDYYLDASNGRFDPYFDVYGPITLPHNMAWYGGNSSGHDGVNARMMAVHACEALDADVDFTQYDRDGDGNIDNVFIFYAGLGEATGGGADTVWPHSAEVIGNYTYDGKTLKTYGCTNEWIMDTAISGHPDGVGTFCHEFGHVLGLPDLYATTYPTPAPFTPGAWSLMDIGPYNNKGRTPPALDLFSRYALGWCDPIVINSAFNGSLEPLAYCGDGYMVTTGDDDEYFLLENRQKVGWDRYIPGHGMLVWHVEYNPGVWMAHTVNNDARHQYVDILEADGKPTESTRSGDAFPGDDGVTMISGVTTPGFVTAIGRSIDIEISDIAELPDGVVTFKAQGGASPADGIIAYEAENVTPRSFVAHWQESDKAIDYRISVYSQQGDVISYVNGYDGRSTGLVSSLLVTTLDPDTQYYYTVSVVTPTSISLPSNEISFTTSALTPAYIIPEVLEAKNVDDQSFVASWLPVDGATDYLITLESKYVEGAEVDTESFDDKTIMWRTNSSTYYSAESYVGKSAPSLRLLPGDYVSTPVVEKGTIRSFSFWHRGRYPENAFISVDVYAHSCWRTISVFPIFTEKGGCTYTVNDFPDDAVAVRIVLHDDTGKSSIYTDDFMVEYGGQETRTLVYDRVSVGCVTSANVKGLQSGTSYFYSVQAVCGDVVTLSSKKEYVQTTGQAHIREVMDDSDIEIFADGDGVNMVSRESTLIEIFDFTGKTVKAMNINAGVTHIALPKGFYIIRIGGRVVRLSI